MSNTEEGTTWFKRSGRKLVAVIAGAAILTGAAGAVLPEPDAAASTWSKSMVVEQPREEPIDFDFDIEVPSDDDGDVKPDPTPKPNPTPKPKPVPFSTKSTWS